MAHFSDYLENAIINATLRGQAMQTPQKVYIALFTSDPKDDASGSELADSNYIRQEASKGDPNGAAAGWTPPSDGVTTNAKLLEFPPIADGTVTVTHFGIFDAVTGGNLLYHAPLTSSKTLETGDVLSFDIGAITITVA